MADTPLLSLNDDEREAAGRLLTAFLDDYEHSIPQRAIFPAIDREVLSDLLTTPFADKGIGVEGFFRLINRKLLPNTTTLSHPRFLAFVVGPGNGIAPYADAIAATINQNCAAWQGGPVASIIEQSIITWLAGLFGYGERAGGIVTAGGSMATLYALATMLHTRRAHFRERGLQTADPPLLVYASAEAQKIGRVPDRGRRAVATGCAVAAVTPTRQSGGGDSKEQTRACGDHRSRSNRRAGGAVVCSRRPRGEVGLCA